MITDSLEIGAARTYGIPLTERFRGITAREGLLIQGAAGWGDFCPFPEYDDATSVAWLAAAVESATSGWPEPLRDRVPVNCTVPVVSPERAAGIVAASGCSTAKVKVGGPGTSMAADVDRVAAVREALGPSGAVRVDANGSWDVEQAVVAIRALDGAAAGLQYVEQPCASIEELAAVRRRVQVPIAADESIRHAGDPRAVALAGAADIAVLKCAPLGGVRRSLAVAAAAGLPCVVSSALESGVGIAAELALAGSLPTLNLACGVATRSLMRGDVVDAGNAPDEPGWLPVPRVSPVPDPDLLDRWAIRDPARERWWRDRLIRCLGLLPPSAGTAQENRP